MRSCNPQCLFADFPRLVISLRKDLSGKNAKSQTFLSAFFYLNNVGLTK